MPIRQWHGIVLGIWHIYLTLKPFECSKGDREWDIKPISPYNKQGRQLTQFANYLPCCQPSIFRVLNARGQNRIIHAPCSHHSMALQYDKTYGAGTVIVVALNAYIQ
jgi:hypothetical protein